MSVSTKTKLVVLISVVAIATLLGWVKFRLKPEADFCQRDHVYEVTFEILHGLKDTELAQKSTLTAKMNWTPILFDGAQNLYQVVVASMRSQGLGDGLDALLNNHRPVTLFLSEQQGRWVNAWVPVGETYPPIVMNSVKSLVELFQFQRANGSAVETDGMGTYEATFTEVNGADRIRKNKLKYLKMHHHSPLPKVGEAWFEYGFEGNYLPENLRFHQRLILSAGFSGELIQSEMAGEAKKTGFKLLDKQEKAQCLQNSFQKWQQGASVRAIPLSYEFHVSSSPAMTLEDARSKANELVRLIGKAKKDPIAQLDELSLILKANPPLLDSVVSGLKLWVGKEEKSAFLISAIVNSETDEALAKLQDLISFYKEKNKTRLVIRVVRSLQFSDYMNETTVRFLNSMAEDSGHTPRARQAALLATGGAAKTLGVVSLSDALLETWEARVKASKNELEQAELISAMGNLANTASVSFLATVIQGKNTYLGDQAVEALRWVRTSQSEAILLSEAIQSDRSSRRQVALDALTFAPLEEASCDRLIEHYKKIAIQFGGTREAERLTLLTALSQQGHRSYSSVSGFLNELPQSPHLTEKEKRYLESLKSMALPH